MHKISINILTWNTYSTLKETLSMLEQEMIGIDHEIIIVDNGSNDGCERLATIKNPRNLGISVGKNQGINTSHGEYIMMIDGDVIPVKNSIRCLYEYMGKHKSIMALGFHPNKWSNQHNRGSEKHHEDWCDQLVDVAESRGHCCYYGMYRKEVFDRGARFDEQYGPGYGYEDLDFFLNMKVLGIKQHVCHINHKAGKYYHNINSSIHVMGRKEYERSNNEREKMFIKKWGNINVG